MLLLVNTTDKLDAVTDTTATLDVHVSYADNNSGTITLGRQLTAISTATTTDICGAPDASNIRNVKTIHIRNKSAATSGTVTVRYNANGTIYELHSVVLRAGESLEYIEGVGWFTLAAPIPILPQPMTGDQALTAASANYLNGSCVTFTSTPTIGTCIQWWFDMSKTGAGTGTSAIAVYFGPNGTTADTSRIATGNLDTETAAADQLMAEITMTIRGPIGASCICQGLFCIDNNLSTTGFSATARKAQVKNVQSAAFDITGLPMKIGIVVTPGASDVATVHQCVAEIQRY